MSDHCTIELRVPMERKVTIMVLKVDLQCSCCYKKVKRLLCKFPQIRDQVFDEKNNTVTIKVVCCSPEKIRDKLCCKGGKSIKSIEIKEPPPPPPPQKPKPPPEKPKTPPPPPPEKPKPPPEKPKPPPQKQCQGIPMPVPWYPPVYPVPVCCVPCSRGQPGGPCYQGYGGMQPPQRDFEPCTCGCGGGAYRTTSHRGYDPCACGCGGSAYCGTRYYTCLCDYYPCRCEENPAACAIM